MSKLKLASKAYKELKNRKDMEQLGLKDSFLSSNRAMRAGDKGLGKVVVSPEVYLRRLKGTFGGMGLGALGGAGLGSVIGKGSGKGGAVGAILGGLLGMSGGAGVGQYLTDRNLLAEKGIQMGPFRSKVTPEAKKKYIDRFKKD